MKKWLKASLIIIACLQLLACAENESAAPVIDANLLPQKSQPLYQPAPPARAIARPFQSVNTTSAHSAIKPYQLPLTWAWPAEGRVVTPFSQNAKGIDIAGKEGSPVYAAATGRIAYSGNGLRGYGNLIIIKHDNLFLSAYAHNRRLLVKEGQFVYKGQKIAEMGHTGLGKTMLHFEIRRASQPIDPLTVLK